jgi:crotonobetainyl-CoA:carnitine CoA-transferase CaiB-like acyl-CoA transferase
VLPLDGVLVVGLEVAVSAPLCTRQLADLGARVIKVETPDGGDFARYYDNALPGTSSYFGWANRGKESVALDLKTEHGRDVLERLLTRADVFVQNLAPGAATRMGLDATSLVERHPRLVAVDISGYGSGGPRSAARAYDLLIQSESGSCAVTGTADAPAKPAVAVADIGTGMTAANAVLAALLARAGSGAGVAISIAMFDVVTDWMSFALHQARSTGIDPPRVGIGSPIVAPYGAYETADGQTVVFGTTNDAEWHRLATVMLQRPDLADNPRYAKNVDRCTYRDELNDVIAEWTARHTYDEATAAADSATIGWARLNLPSDVVTHPQLSERERWVTTQGPGGSFESLRPPADVAGWTWSPGAVPAVGEHTASVLRELGFDD